MQLINSKQELEDLLEAYSASFKWSNNYMLLDELRVTSNQKSSYSFRNRRRAWSYWYNVILFTDCITRLIHLRIFKLSN